MTYDNEICERMEKERDRITADAYCLACIFTEIYEAGPTCRDMFRNVLGSYGFRKLEEFAANKKVFDAAFDEWVNA